MVVKTNMNTYGITFIHDNSTITMKAEFYEFSDGFIHLYREDDHAREKFASYIASNVRHIVLQNEYTEDEVLEQTKD